VGRILICILGIAGSACAEKTFDYIKHGSPLGCLHPIQNRGTSSPDALPVFTGERAGAHRFRILICGLLVIVNCEKIKPYLTTFSPVLKGVKIRRFSWNCGCLSTNFAVKIGL